MDAVAFNEGIGGPLSSVDLFAYTWTESKSVMEGFAMLTGYVVAGWETIEPLLAVKLFVYCPSLAIIRTLTLTIFMAIRSTTCSRGALTLFISWAPRIIPLFVYCGMPSLLGWAVSKHSWMQQHSPLHLLSCSAPALVWLTINTTRLPWIKSPFNL